MHASLPEIKYTQLRFHNSFSTIATVQGIMEYSKDPEEKRTELMCSFLSYLGTTPTLNIEIQSGKLKGEYLDCYVSLKYLKGAENVPPASL